MNVLGKCASSFIFLGFRAKEMYFKVNEHRVGTEFDLDFDLETNFDYEDLVDKSKCTVSLSASFFKDYETSGKNYPFEFKIVLEGYFCASKSEMNVQQFHSLSEKNGVAMLFPYLRSIICDASKMANIPPILLPSMNILKFLEERKQNK